ncbi:MAG TPA: hypothetical protein VLE72_01525, partial [Candidatus Saccharimonadales bacterium]|nr:hypothetical protein [Candidatus Saccharimonadales bacterium]
MASASDILTKATEEYHLSLNDVKFWTPYWINWAKPPYHLDAPLAGKGTPTELRSALLDIVAKIDQLPRTGDDYRSLMKQHGLGVDCSALAYHILERLVRDLTDQDLAEHLFAPKTDIIEASQKPSWQEAGVSQQTLAALPDQITIAEVSRLFKRKPRHITNVARLTAEAATKAVSASDIQPGDMIKMTSA